MEVGLVLVTYNSEKYLNRCLSAILSSSIQLKLLVVDASSRDQTRFIASTFDIETVIVPYLEYNHGLTREMARKALKTEIVVFMTPDAYLKSPKTLEKLIHPILEKKASISYARQIPRKTANFFESFLRSFNYPKQGHVRGIEDLEKYGPYLYFSSNSLCAYLNDALDQIGGFTQTLLAEDQIAAAKLLQKGHKIAYVSEAICEHSHLSTLLFEFQRYFDIGYMRKVNKTLFSHFGKMEKLGARYSLELIRALIKNRIRLIPYGILHCAAKYLGYKLGSSLTWAPLSWKRHLSSQKFYWYV